MPTFAPPVVHDVPTVVAPGEEGERGNRLFRYYRPRPRGLNVYIYRAGSDIATREGNRVSETDPYPTYNPDGTLHSDGWQDVEAVFWGGHAPVEVTNAQAVLLAAAGYEVDVTPPPVVVPDPPFITLLSPNSGTANTHVVVSGANFTGVTSVTVDGVAATFQVTSDIELNFTTPAHADGAVSVVITSPYGSDSDTFTYVTPAPSDPPVLSGISPNTGVVGTPVVLTGSNLTDVTSVTFDGVSASFSILSDTSISTTSTAHIDGAVNVIAINSNGSSNAVTFTYVTPANPDPPTLTSLVPQTGPSGSTLTINGTTFRDILHVFVGADEVSATVVSQTQLTCTLPTHADGAVLVTVQTTWGQSNSLTFTYSTPQPPTISSLSPDNGLVGSSVTITGTNLAAATSVAFGATSASFSVQSATSIIATVPSLAAAAYTVTVTSAAGTSGGLTYTVNVPPPTDPHPGTDILSEDSSYILAEDGSSTIQAEEG